MSYRSGNMRDSDYSYGKYRNNDEYRDRDHKKTYRDRSRERYRERSRSRSWERDRRDDYGRNSIVPPGLETDDSYPRERNNYYNNDKKSRERERGRDRERSDVRDYRGKYDYDSQNNSNYYDNLSDSQSDPGNGNSSNAAPNKKLVVRGLPLHITEADIQGDLIQCGLKPVSVRLVRKKKTGASCGFAFVEFSTTDEAMQWYNMKQGILTLQDQYRAVIHYSIVKDNGNNSNDKPKEMKILTDWYCGKCGVFNFKRRENCFKCYASREESEKGGEGSDEVSNILTKKIIFRNLDALTNEESVLSVLQEVIPTQVSKISKVLICRDTLTQTSRGICYLYFDNLVDSMNTLNALKALDPPLLIDSREVLVSYCIDAENRNISNTTSKSKSTGGYNNDTNNVNYQYTLNDVKQLAEYSASLYSTTPEEKESYIKFYTDYYTQQITQGSMANLPSFSQFEGAAVAFKALSNKYNKSSSSSTTSSQVPSAPQITTPKGNDGKKYPVPDPSQFFYDQNSGFYWDPYTGLYYDPTSTYYYNTEINSYMYFDSDKQTYILAPQTETTESVVSTTAIVAGIDQAPPPPPTISVPEAPKDEMKKTKEPQDKVKVAKKIVKDMEKWAKQLNQKKDYVPTMAVNQNSQSPPSQSKTSDAAFSVVKQLSSTDYSLYEKKERTTGLSFLANQNPTTTEKLVPAYDSDSDEPNTSSTLSEKDYVDFEKLTCNLCKRAFQSPDILSKHLKMSNLHKENLQKYKLQHGIIETANSAHGLTYRDRAKERRLKYGESDPPPVNKSRERYNREIEKQSQLAAYQSSSSLASTPISESNIGNKLLHKMGWKDGMGLGKTNQGRTDIIETEARVSNAGLGSKNSSFGAAGDDYKTYIKKMMKSRYESAQINE